jgi:hypothetical protein
MYRRIIGPKEMLFNQILRFLVSSICTYMPQNLRSDKHGGAAIHICNPSTWETEAVRLSLRTA